MVINPQISTIPHLNCHPLPQQSLTLAIATLSIPDKDYNGLNPAYILVESNNWQSPPGQPVDVRDRVQRLLRVVHGPSDAPGFLLHKIKIGNVRENLIEIFDQPICGVRHLLHRHSSSSSSTSPSSTSSSSSSSSRPITLDREHLNPLYPPFFVLYVKETSLYESKT